MQKKKFFTTKMIVQTAILTAVEIVLQLLSMVIPTPVNLNLSLVAITIGSIIGGPVVGGFLGFVNGAVILLSPNTVTVFMAISPLWTVVVCLLKTTLAGVAGGFIYKALKKKNDFLGAILASIAVPVVNTGIFVLVTYFAFLDALGLPDFASIFTVLIGFSFLFEVVSNVVISPTLYKVMDKTITRKPED